MAPLRLAGFRSLFLGYEVNELGNWIGEIALAVLVYDQTGSPLATAGLFLGMQFLPGFLSPALISRAEVSGTRIVLPLFYLVEAALFLALVVSVDNFSLPVVLALATLDGVIAIAGRAFIRAANAAVLTPAGLLREGNAIFNVGSSITNFAGPALGGVAVALLGVRGTLLLDVVSFVAVALVLAATRSLPQVQAEPSPWRARLRESVSYVAARRPLAALLAAQAAAIIFFTAPLPVEIVYVKETLDAGDSAYGALLGAWGVGMVAGSLVFTAFSRAPIRVLLVVSTLAIGFGYVGMGVADSIVAACAAAVLGGAGNGVQWVSTLTAVQEMTAERFQARVVGLLEAVSSALPGLGFVLGGLLAAAFDPRVTFLAAGFGVVLVVAVAALSLRQVRWATDVPA
jgi:MFS family permease